MPIYEYTCGKCDHAFEQLVFNKNDEKNIVCPECGDKKVTKLLSCCSNSIGSSSSGACTGSAPKGFS